MSPAPIIIAPSILSADFGRLQEEVDSIEPHADWIQLDIMDGHFVPNISFGVPVVRRIQTKLPLDVHLMVSNPADRVAEFLEIGAAHVTFHAEAVEGTEERKALIKAIRDGGAGAGIALNPETPLGVIDDVIGDIDLLLIMSVHPGFGGQDFLPEVLGKVRDARGQHPDLMIQMDGGIDDQSVGSCIEAGANNFVSGSYIFESEDRSKAIASLRG